MRLMRTSTVRRRPEAADAHPAITSGVRMSAAYSHPSPSSSIGQRPLHRPPIRRDVYPEHRSPAPLKPRVRSHPSHRPNQMARRAYPAPRKRRPPTITPRLLLRHHRTATLHASPPGRTGHRRIGRVLSPLGQLPTPLRPHDPHANIHPAPRPGQQPGNRLLRYPAECRLQRRRGRPQPGA